MDGARPRSGDENGGGREQPRARVDASAIESVLVIKPSSLGDVVQTLPAVNLLKRRFPHLEIRWIVHTAWAPLLKNHPSLAGLVPFPREKFRGITGPIGFWRWARRLDRLRPDVVLDFQGLLRSALMGRFSGATRILGLSDSREGARFFYDEVVPVSRGMHSVERYLGLAGALGAHADADADTLEYLLPEGAKPKAGEAEELADGFVLLHPFSRGAGKTLSVEQVRCFCDELAPRTVAVVGNPPAGEATASLPANAVDLSNQTTLLELLWLMRRAAFVVSVDSGPMHLAAAVTENLLGIHTWTDPRKTGPFRGASWVWKAGAIRRVAELGAGDDSLKENRAGKMSSLTRGNLEEIAAFVAERLGEK